MTAHSRLSLRSHAPLLEDGDINRGAAVGDERAVCLTQDFMSAESRPQHSVTLLEFGSRVTAEQHLSSFYVNRLGLEFKSFYY